VPTLTDARIEELCARIRALCLGPFSHPREVELKVLARKLREAVSHHVSIARSNLRLKKSAIDQRDPDKKTTLKAS